MLKDRLHAELKFLRAGLEYHYPALLETFATAELLDFAKRLDLDPPYFYIDVLDWALAVCGSSVNLSAHMRSKLIRVRNWYKGELSEETLYIYKEQLKDIVANTTSKEDLLDNYGLPLWVFVQYSEVSSFACERWGCDREALECLSLN